MRDSNLVCAFQPLDQTHLAPCRAYAWMTRRPEMRLRSGLMLRFSRLLRLSAWAVLLAPWRGRGRGRKVMDMLVSSRPDPRYILLPSPS